MKVKTKVFCDQFPLALRSMKKAVGGGWEIKDYSPSTP